MKRPVLFLVLSVFVFFHLKPNLSHGQMADTAKELAKMGAVTVGANYAAKTMFEEKCKANPGYCWIAAGFAAQVVLSGLATDSASKTGRDVTRTDPWGSGGGGPNIRTDFPDNDLIPLDIRNDIDRNFPNLEKEGFTLDMENNKVNGPNGKSMPFNSLTPENLLAEGLLDPEDMDEINKMMEEHKHRVASIGLAGGGGAGGGGASRRPTTYEYYDPFAQMGMGDKNKPRDPKASGLSRQLGNTHVGIASDNIFEMIHRRYESKVAEGIFVSP